MLDPRGGGGARAALLGLVALGAVGCALVVRPYDPDAPVRRDGMGYLPGNDPSPCGNGVSVPIDPPGLIVRNLGGRDGTGTDCLAPNDDGSSAEVSLGGSFADGLGYFGAVHRSLWVNTNGNVTFRSALGTYTPQAFPIRGQPLIAPWWADVDTRGAGTVCFAQRPGLFFATWFEVGYFSSHTDQRNTLQLILRARPDLGARSFEAQFRYARCEWVTGDASGGRGGHGGTQAQVGFDSGDGANFVMLPASRTERIVEVCRGTNVGRPGIFRFVIADGTPREGDNCQFAVRPDAGPIGDDAALDGAPDDTDR